MIFRRSCGSSNIVRIITFGPDDDEPSRPSGICFKVFFAFLRVLSTCMIRTLGLFSCARATASCPVFVFPTTSTSPHKRRQAYLQAPHETSCGRRPGEPSLASAVLCRRRSPPLIYHHRHSS